MTRRITLQPGPSPVSQISDQIRGAVASGQLAAGEALPSVRQLAKDLGIAPGTVAKAYRALETDGIVVTRVGGGTRVGEAEGAVPASVLKAAAALAEAASDHEVGVDEATRILRAVWPE